MLFGEVFFLLSPSFMKCKEKKSDWDGDWADGD